MPGDRATAEEIAALLSSRTDCVCENGLSRVELDRAETTLSLAMPPLWREVLQIVHPVPVQKPPRDPDGVLRWTGFPDWRLRNESETRKLVDAPVEGLLFDVEYNDFWWSEWGEAPVEGHARVTAARSHLATAPRLTPLWGHLYVGSDDESPVFSIMQADLYVRYLTLGDLLTGTDESDVPPDAYPIGNVPFWSHLHAWSQIGHFTDFGDLARGGL